MKEDEDDSTESTYVLVDVISSSWKENTAWGNLTQIILFKQTQKKKKKKKESTFLGTSLEK